MVSGWWTAAPASAALLCGVVCAYAWHADHRAEHVPFVLSLYGCAAFFAHGYSVAWRAGVYFWQYLAMLVSVSILSFLAWIHSDDLAIGGATTGGASVAESGAGLLIAAMGSNIIVAGLLLLHCTVLGFGMRAPVSAVEEVAV